MRSTWLAASLLSGLLSAQTIDEVVPPVAAPGDEVILRGSGLGGTVQVSFTAQVGGFVGVLLKGVTPSAVSDSEVRALVPAMQAFVGPIGAAPSSPYGEVSIQLLTPVVVPGAQFFFVEETMGALATLGQGSSLPTPAPALRPTIAFDLGLGAPLVPPAGLPPGSPFQPNPNFTPRLHDGLPGQLPFLLVGAPAAPPFPLLGDGTLVVNPAQAISLAAPPVDASGRSELPLPVPPGVSGTVSLQWVLLDLIALEAYVSNGLRVAL